MNTDTFYSLIFICTAVLYLILVYIQVKRIIKDRNYRKPWIEGLLTLSVVILFMGMVTPVNLIGTFLSAIVLLILLYILEKKKIIEKD